MRSVTDAMYMTGQQLPGTVYRVVRHLATGGMGSVYDVEDVTVGKRYVLKTLHPQLVSREDLARRMEAEARTLAKLQHPNIVDVVTAGVTGDAMKMPFYVMERLNGQNLRVLLEKRGIIELSHAFRIAIDVLDALEHAHENNVIHRDVKPENIFLHRQINGTTITKLLDFGIMRLLDRKRSHTQGRFIGTLRYASPEQIMGGDLGPPTDLYSLGLVLYEMIAGRGPFDDAGDAYAVGAAHAQKAPPPISAFTQVPRHVEALVMCALAKEPSLRPRDAFTFASELRRMLREEEAAPKSATAVNVLSQVPPTRGPDPAYDGTVPAYEGEAVPSSGPRSPLAATSATAEGMPVPSAVGPAPLAANALASATSPTLLAGQGSQPGVRPFDREAATHTSVPFGHTLRIASNGTEIDGLGAPLADPNEAPIEAVHAALGQREGLVVPPVEGPRSSRPGPSELVFATGPQHGPTPTGPTAGEARTRPPERALFVPLVAALLVGGLVVGGAVVLVRGKLAGEQGHASAPAMTAPPVPTPAAPVASSAPLASEPVPPPAAPVASTASTPSAAPSPARSAKPEPKPRATAPAAPVAPTATSHPKPAARPVPAAPKVPGYDD